MSRPGFAEIRPTSGNGKLRRSDLPIDKEKRTTYLTTRFKRNVKTPENIGPFEYNNEELGPARTPRPV